MNANAEVRDATWSDCTFISALMISSAIPSVKYSFSGSALMLANGSTAIDVRAATAGVASGVALGGVTTRGDPSACATRSADWNRSPGSLARLLVTTCSSSAETYAPLARTDGTGSVKRFMITACMVEPVNGAAPVSISKSTQPRL